MKTTERAAGKKATGRSKAESDADVATGDDAGFFPKAQQLGAQAFADGTKVMEDASTFVRTVHQISQEAESSLSDSMGQRPYVVLGAAATVGFVLGRGLTLGMSRTLLGVGGKMAMTLLIKRVTANAL